MHIYDTGMRNIIESETGFANFVKQIKSNFKIQNKANKEINYPSSTLGMDTFTHSKQTATTSIRN